MQTYEELKKMNEATLLELLQKQREELRENRFLVAASQQKNVRKLRELRKNIARILMVVAEAKQNGTTSSTGAFDENVGKRVSPIKVI